MAKRGKKKVDENETSNQKFRRVVNQRLTPLVKRIEQLTNMAWQPTYEYSDDDILKLMATVKTSVNKFNETWQKALDGTLKAKEIKKFSGIDWDKELIEQ